MKPPVFNVDGQHVSYIPMEELIENMRKSLIMPYKSVFSFIPLIEKLHHRVESAHCEMTEAMLPQVEEMERRLHENYGIMDEELKASVDGLTKMLLPSMYFEGEYGFISPPFLKEFIYSTPALEDLTNKDKWLVKVSDDFLKRKEYGNVQNVAALLLNKFYGQSLDLSVRDNITFRNVVSGRETHLRLDIRQDFMEIEVNGDLREISDSEMNYLLNNFSDDDVVLEYLPADKFTLKGMGVGMFTDVTILEIQSMIKDSVLNVGNIRPEDFIRFLEQQLNDYLRRDDLEIGMVDLLFIDQENGFNMSLSGIGRFEELTTSVYDHESCHSYLKAYCKKKPVIVGDLRGIENKSIYEQGLIEKGFKSAILIPLTDTVGKVTSIVEIGSEEKFAFNTTDVKKLYPIIELLALGNEVFLREFNNKVESFIKSKFTAIHPSVEWKFEQIAIKHQILQEKDGVEAEIEPVVFQDVYPLYGQLDIRNSSEIRNNAIQEDLIDNLELVIEVMKAFQGFVEFHLLDAFLLKAVSALDKMRSGYTSSIESSTVELLTKEVHPLLKQLQNQFQEIPNELIGDYFMHLDDELGIVNKHRRDYENSVNKLNKKLSNFLEKEDEKMQQILPHYFEKYKTDGVEYNIYIGQSMLKNEQFSQFHLRDFRLWQLVNMAEATVLLTELKPKMKIPLETSQLIFVYNSAMSIRFRMDEKRFDVDGTYNVRYEILKKRIDKAVIKGSGERLTQAGKIAIVYLLEKDREEYMGYVEYLTEKGLIEGDVEDLALDRLQGADGLRALRITVKTD